MKTYTTALQAERAYRRLLREAEHAKYQLDSLRQREADIAAEQERISAHDWAVSMGISKA